MSMQTTSLVLILKLLRAENRRCIPGKPLKIQEYSSLILREEEASSLATSAPPCSLKVVRHEIAYHFVVAIFFQLIFDRIVVKVQT
jgi:hypothetical protein